MTKFWFLGDIFWSESEHFSGGHLFLGRPGAAGFQGHAVANQGARSWFPVSLCQWMGARGTRVHHERPQCYYEWDKVICPLQPLGPASFTRFASQRGTHRQNRRGIEALRGKDWSKGVQWWKHLLFHLLRFLHTKDVDARSLSSQIFPRAQVFSL